MPEKVANLDMGGVLFTGTVLFGRRNGFGTGLYEDGSKYCGMWVNDERNGSGKYEDTHGGFEEGMWFQDKKRG